MTLFVEQKECELELSVAGTLVNAPLLEGLERVFHKPVSSRALDAKDSACGAVAELGYGEEGVILDKRGRVVAYRKGWKTYLFCVVAAISVRLSFGLSFRLSFTLSPDRCGFIHPDSAGIQHLLMIKAMNPQKPILISYIICTFVGK